MQIKVDHKSMARPALHLHKRNELPRGYNKCSLQEELGAGAEQEAAVNGEFKLT